MNQPTTTRAALGVTAMNVPFRERNPVIIGAVSLAVIAALILAAFRAQDLPLIGGGDTYYASFTEAGGLKANDEVRIAGVRVGKVEEVELDGDQVQVTFRIEADAEFGSETGAAIKVKTLLGAMFLALEPAGDGQLEEESEIPVERTSSPYDVVEAFSGPRRDLRRDRHRPARRVADHARRPDPQHARGVPRRRSTASPGSRPTSRPRDEQINSLLGNLERVSTVLDDARPGHHRADGGRRRPVPRAGGSAARRSTACWSRPRRSRSELTALVRQSRADLKPALTHLENVLDVLNKNEDNLDNSLRLMAPFYRVFANTLGTGPWFDTYIQNIPARSRRWVPDDDDRQACRRAAGPRGARGRRRVRDVRRRGAQDAHRALPAHHLALRGQRRAGARRAGRQGRHGDAVRHRRRRDHVLRRRDRDPRGRPGRDHLAVDRGRPLRPAHPGLRRRARCSPTAPPSRPTAPRSRSSSTRSTPASTTSTSPSARPAPTATARSPTCSRPPPRTSAARASSSTRRSRTSASSARPSTTTRRSCSAPPRRSRASSAPSPRTTPRCGDFNQSLGRRLAGARRRAPGAGGRRCATSRRRSTEVAVFVKENREILGRNIEGLNRVAKVLVKQRGALDEILRTAPVALNNLDLTYNPQAGTLDTSANIGELGGQIEPTRRRSCAASSARPTRPARSATPSRTAASAASALPRPRRLRWRGPAPSPGLRTAFDPTLGGTRGGAAMRRTCAAGPRARPGAA